MAIIKKKKLRIGIDGRYAQSSGGGVNRYIQELISYIVKKGSVPVVISTKRIPIPQKGAEYHIIHKKLHGLVWEQVQLPLLLRSLDLDLYHATANSGIPFLSNLPTILTVHDIIPILDKEYFAQSKFPFLSKSLYSLSIKAALYKSSKVICTTNIVVGDVKKSLKVDSKKISIIPMAVDDKFFENKKSSDKNILRKHDIQSNFMLNFGGIDKRKNIAGMLRAYSLFLKTTKSKLDLVITGGDKMQISTYKDDVDDLGLKNRVHFTGWLEYKELPILIRNAQFVIYPTLAEGFGLPLIEAMASGIPVVTSRLPTFLEKSRDVPIYTDPKKTKSIVDGMILASKGTNIDMLNKGRKIASIYNWNNTMEKTYDIYSMLNTDLEK